jgi:predicted MFS family arabinose efflux permease
MELCHFSLSTVSNGSLLFGGWKLRGHVCVGNAVVFREVPSVTVIIIIIIIMMMMMIMMMMTESPILTAGRLCLAYVFFPASF